MTWASVGVYGLGPRARIWPRLGVWPGLCVDLYDPGLWVCIAWGRVVLYDLGTYGVCVHVLA
jgi:hypothetical protein